jgi:hypothetical protein
MKMQFMPNQPCGVGIDSKSVPLIEPLNMEKIQEIKDGGRPVVGARGLLADIVQKNISGPHPERVVARAVMPVIAEEVVPPVAAAAGGPPNCEALCKALEAENRALVSVIARLHAENAALKAGKA